MRLPFTIYDGKKSQVCTYEDLFIIVELGLDATVYSRETEWFGFRHKKHYGMGTLILLYASIKAIHQNANYLPHGYISAVDSTRIFSITCRDLHKWRNNPFIKLMMQMEDGV